MGCESSDSHACTQLQLLNDPLELVTLVGLRASCWCLALWGGTNSDNASCRDFSRWQSVEQNKILAGIAARNDTERDCYIKKYERFWKPGICGYPQISLQFCNYNPGCYF